MTGLVGFIIDGTRRGTYNHFNSEPNYLGGKLVQFILSLSEEERRVMIQRLTEITWIVTGFQRDKTIYAHYMALKTHLTSYDKEEREDIPQLYKPTVAERIYRWDDLFRGVQGATSLPLILDGTLKHLVDYTCDEEDDVEFDLEFVYWIDFEKMTLKLEGYKPGFSDDPSHGDRRSWSFEELKSDQWWKECIEVGEETDGSRALHRKKKNEWWRMWSIQEAEAGQDSNGQSSSSAVA